jgi:hypothetical protein
MRTSAVISLRGWSKTPRQAMLYAARAAAAKFAGRAGTGKSGGVRVIHYNRLADGVIYLLLIYAKNARDDIPAKTLKLIRETIDAEND